MTPKGTADQIFGRIRKALETHGLEATRTEKLKLRKLMYDFVQQYDFLRKDMCLKAEVKIIFIKVLSRKGKITTWGHIERPILTMLTSSAVRLTISIVIVLEHVRVLIFV